MRTKRRARIFPCNITANCYLNYFKITGSSLRTCWQTDIICSFLQKHLFLKNARGEKNNKLSIDWFKTILYEEHVSIFQLGRKGISLETDVVLKVIILQKIIYIQQHFTKNFIWLNKMIIKIYIKQENNYHISILW